MREINLKNVKDLLDSGSLGLVATQGEICLPILQRIYKKMKLGIEFDNIRVRDTRIVDGHHRYVCSILSDTEIGKNDWPIPSTAINYNWKEVIINEDDYEDAEMIRKHNIRDAELNDVDISILNNL